MSIKSFIVAVILAASLSAACAQQVGGTSGINSASGSGGGSAVTQITKRTVLNMNLMGSYREWWTNNFFLQCSNFPGTGGNNTTLDSTGYPTGTNVSYNLCNMTSNGTGKWPGTSGATGPYILYGKGTATHVATGLTSTLTVVSGVDCPGGSGYGVSQVSNGIYAVTATGANGDWCIEFTYPSSGTEGNIIPAVAGSNPAGNGSYIKDLFIGFAADFKNWQMGRIGRVTWEQEVANLNPGYIRFMNLQGPAYAGVDVRWENRNLPSNVGWTGINWLVSPPYGATSGTNAITVASATGTPPSMTHGEFASILLSNVASGSPGALISSITNSTTPVVALSGNVSSYFGTGVTFTGYIDNGSGGAGNILHVITLTGGSAGCPGSQTNCFGFATGTCCGQTIFGVGVAANSFINGLGTGLGGTGTYTLNGSAQLVGSAGSPITMTGSAYLFVTGDKVLHWNTGTNLNFFPATISTACGSADALHYCITNYDTTSVGAISAGVAAELWTLNIGGRGAFPIVNVDGVRPISEFFNPIGPGNFQSNYCFNKNTGGTSDGAGHWNLGVWLICADDGNSFANGASGGFTTPLETQVGLLNEINSLRPLGTSPTGFWWNSNYMALQPHDPDWTSASDYPTNALNVILNGANGYSGLLYNAPIMMEKGNEDFNMGPSVQFSCNAGNVHFGGAITSNIGCGDTADYSTLRAIIFAEDIKGSPYYNNRVDLCLGYWGTNGTGTTWNNVRLSGDTAVNTDPWNVWFAATGATPMSHYDVGCVAPYIFPTGGTQLEAAATTWAACGNQPCRDAAISGYITTFISNCPSPIQGCINWQTGTFNDAFWISTMKNLGKCWGNYEGYLQLSWTGFSTQGNAFAAAMRASSIWASTWMSYISEYNAPGGCIPATYTETGDPDWSFFYPDTFVGGVEGAALAANAVWGAITAYNQGKQ